MVKKFLLFFLIACGIVIGSKAQTTYYYKLTKTVKNGDTSTDVSGGQFITFNNKLCYESDKRANQVNESRMEYKYTDNGINVYNGRSYWGVSTTFFFTIDNSKLSVRTSSGDKYVYERCVPPSGTTTCSLIRERESGGTIMPAYPIGGNSGGYNGVSGSSGSTSGGNIGTVSTPRQQITKTCGVCHGTGTCNICGGDGWVTRMGMGKDGYCPSCNNHDGRCPSCHGRGTWKE